MHLHKSLPLMATQATGRVFALHTYKTVMNVVGADNIFAGNEKDFFFAADWFWKLGTAKDKNDIANGAAALVSSVIVNNVTLTGSFLVFAGDRITNNGDAQIGFWFFQNGTAPVTVSGVNTFSPEKNGLPYPGDLLVLADFTGGGNNAAVTVLMWTPGTGTYPNSDNNFTQVTTGAAVAENNAGPVSVPGCWNFTDKNTGSTTQYSTNEFYEGYINLADFITGGTLFCPSTYMLETRASQSITAVLDDFVGGPLAGAPNCSITGTNTICAGSSTCFTASGGTGSFTYNWSGPSSYTASGAVICNLTAAGTYNVTVRNVTGCTTSCSRTLTVNSAPACNITGNNTICAGTSTCFTATGGGTYAWAGPGGFSATGAVICNLTTAGTYNVTVTSAAGCTSTCSRSLTVNTNPSCNITGNNTICAGTSTCFTATGGGTYAWSGPGGFNATGAVICNLTAAGTYNVTVTSTAGCTSSCSRTLTVNPNPSCDITGNNTICAGTSTCFTATGGGTYAWAGPGGFSATGAVICNLTAAGTYNVTVTSTAGCTSSCSRTLTVNPTPSCNITGNNTICAGNSASFTATGGGTYAWSGPGGFSATGAVISNLTAAGTYNVTVTSAAGCTSSCSRTLTVITNPECSITGNNTICAGTSTCFTASGGNTYAWAGPGGFSATGAVICNLTAAGTYNVTVTAAGGCTSSCSRTLTVNPTPSCNITGNNTICSYQSASFTATGGGTYLWSTGATSAIISNLTAAGTYSVTVTSAAGCTSSCSRTLTVNNPPSCNITGNNTICVGNSASFTATGGGTYLWSTGATGAVISNLTAAGTYSVTVTSAQGCTSSCSRILTVNQTPTVSAGSDPASKCRSATVTNGSLVFGTDVFSVTGSNLTNAVLAVPAWSIAPGGNPAGFTVNIVSPNSLTTNVELSGNVNGGSVTLRITANSNATPSCGTATDDVTLTLNPRPLVKTLIGSDFCPNVTLTGSVALLNSQNGVSYQLMDDGPNPVQAPKLGDGGTLLWTGLSDGSYTVVGTFLATSCSTTSGPADVVENPVPDVHITPFGQRCNSGVDPVNLALIVDLLGGTWSGTGVSGNFFDPNGLAPGVYTLTYTFTNLQGCRVSAQLQTTVVSCAAQICTYTQGYFGNPGGLSCDGTDDGFTTTELINQSLGNWPGGFIRIGVSQILPTNIQNYVQINDADAACIIDVLPGGGPAKEVSGANQICSLPASMLQNGRIHNVLLAQTIALGLNIGISPPDLGDFPLQAGTLYTAEPVGGCGSNVPKLRVCHYDATTHLLTSVENEYTSRSFSQALIDAIEDAGYPKTVSGLFGLANDALGNKDGVVGTEQGISLSEIAGGAGSINEVFDECRISVGWNIGACPPSNVPSPARITASANAEAATVGKLKVSTYPNPYRNNVRFVIESPVAGQAILDVYNIAGQKIQTLFNGHIDANETRTIDYKPAVANGMMIYTLRIGNKQVTGKLVGLKQ
jgi:spore coat protein CotF